jgi:hypothetical protein
MFSQYIMCLPSLFVYKTHCFLFICHRTFFVSMVSQCIMWFPSASHIELFLYIMCMYLFTLQITFLYTICLHLFLLSSICLQFVLLLVYCPPSILHFLYALCVSVLASLFVYKIYGQLLNVNRPIHRVG